MVTYPDYNLANQLKTVARLLSGGSQTKIFLVKIGGFDTHVDQVEGIDNLSGKHNNLLTELSTSIKAFQDDLEALSLADKVMTFSFSEFGRKAAENGSFGTDHGTMAPMFVFGNAVAPGTTGTNVDLDNIVDGQLQNHQHDYRQVFTTLLQDWMGADDTILADTMFDAYLGSKLPFIDAVSVVDPACYSGPLPVELSFFKARLIDNKKVTLSWDTASEVNSDYFEVERSQDGKDFEAIIKTAAKGNLTLVNHYQEIDEEPLTGTSYYRLKQVDQYGQFEYSKIAVVELIPPMVTNIRLYPNPAVYDFQLAFMSEKTGTVQIRIINMAGNLLRQRSLSVKEGFNKFSFPVDRLPTGTYVVEIFSAELGVREHKSLVKNS
ncbi:MAG: hypothetical protein ACI9XB_004728 [Gammaproteobacteria bacterium]|jgi:hypothetical protein